MIRPRSLASLSCLRIVLPISAASRCIKAGHCGPHLQCEFELPGRRKQGQILALGHSDTVYPMGTLAKMPFREKDGRLWGPGVLDMKGGIAFFVFAMRALRELDIPVRQQGAAAAQQR